MRDIFASPSRLDKIQLCWRYYNYTGVRKLEPFVRAPRMERGTVGHAVLAYYYAEKGYNLNRAVKKPRAQIIDEAFKIGLMRAAKTNLKKEDLTIVFDVLNAYFKHYENETWTPLLDDKGEPLVEVPLTKVIYERSDTSEVEGIRIIFNAILDLVLPPAKVDGVQLGTRIVDHKFISQHSELNPLANQLALYSAVTGIPDVMLNEAGTQKEGNVNKFTRPSYRYSKSQQSENIRWAIYWMLEADSHNSMEVYPPNPTSCDKFGGCMFSNGKSGVCTTIEQNREAVINANFREGEGFSIYGAEKHETVKDLLAPPVETVEKPLSSVREEERPVEGLPVPAPAIVPLVQSDVSDSTELRTEEAPRESLVDRILKAEKEI